MMSAESNKALVRRSYEEIDKGNIGVLDEVVAEDYLDHNPPPFPGLASGREGLKQSFKMFQHATPGYHQIEDQIAEGDKVVTRLTAIGKHEGDLPGLATNRRDAPRVSSTDKRRRPLSSRAARACADPAVEVLLVWMARILALPSR